MPTTGARKIFMVWWICCCIAVGVANPAARAAEGQEPTIMDQAVASADVRRQLIAQYESSPQTFRDDRLLAAAIAYAVENRIEMSRPVYERYLKDHPHNPRALRGLGGGYLIEQRYDKAIVYLRKAWELGDVASLSPLAAAYEKANRYAGMKDLIPSLMEHSHGNAEIVNEIIAYAMSYSDPPDIKLVFKALSELDDKSILLRKDTTDLLSKVVSYFAQTPGLEVAQMPILAKIVRGYQADPESWPANRRIEVADSYVLLSLPGDAEAIYREILKDSPNDAPTLRGLGISLAYQRKFADGITPLRKAWDQGDMLSLTALSACYLGTRDFEGLKDLVPALMARRKTDMECLNTVIGYAIFKPSPDRALFFQAIEGFSDEQLVRNKNVGHNTILGLKLFGEKARAERLEKLQAEQERGVKA